MQDNSVLYIGAEAEIRRSTYMGIAIIQKKRLAKGYRIKEIDEALISSRTREESKLMIEARSYGVAVPIIYDVNLAKGIISMEYLKGERIKDIFNTLSDSERIDICKTIGENIAHLHNNDIIHGDLFCRDLLTGYPLLHEDLDDD